MLISNSNYVTSLVDYILDVKPYHTKLTEVIEEYQFFDYTNVKITEAEKYRINLNSVWTESYISDSFVTRFIIPPFYMPRFSLEGNNHTFNSVSEQVAHLNVGQFQYRGSTYKYNLPNCYQLRANRGIESVVIDGTNFLAEGIDYYESKGMLSFVTDEPSQNERTWIQTKDIGLPIGTLANLPYSGNIVNGTVSVSDISVNFDVANPDEYVVECAGISEVMNFDFTASEALVDAVNKKITYTFTHNFGSQYLVFETYLYDANGLLHAALQQVQIVDDNTVQIVFPYKKVKKVVQIPTGTIRIVSVPSISTYFVTSASTTWTINHRFNSMKLLPYVFVLTDNGYTSILPKSVVILNADTIQITFSSKQIGYVVILPAANEGTFTEINDTNSITFTGDFSAGKEPLVRAFTRYNGNIVQVIPQDITCTSTELTVSFDTTVTPNSFAVLSQPSTDYWFMVLSANYGFINYASSFTPFTGRGITFTANGPAKVGDYSVIGPQHNVITVHPSAPKETWTLIKTNSISYNKPTYVYTGLTTVIAVATPAYLQTIKVPDQYWSVTCVGVNYTNNNATFNVDLCTSSNVQIAQITVSLNTPTINLDIGGMLAMSFTPGSRGIHVGDYAQFDIGYDADYYGIGGYDNGEYTGPDDPTDYGVTVELIPFINPPKILPIASAYIKAPTEVWTFTFNQAGGYFTALGSVSGNQRVLFPGEEYDNGIIRFRMSSQYTQFDPLKAKVPGYLASYGAQMVANGEIMDGDVFYLQVTNRRPSVLVYGSVSGWQKPAAIGEFYWNGLIGFQLDNPYYEVVRENIVIGNSLTDNHLTLDFNFSIDFNSAPRFDTISERIEFKYLPTGLQLTNVRDASYNLLSTSLTPNPLAQYTVFSALRGNLPGAVVGTEYKDLETNFIGSDRNFTIDLTLNQVNPDIAPPDFSLHITTSEWFKPFHSQDVLVLQNPSTGKLVVNTYLEDQFTLQLKTSHPELGSSNYIVPTFILAAADYDDSEEGYDGYSNSAGTYTVDQPFDSLGYDTFDGDVLLEPRLQSPAVPDRGYRYEVWASNAFATETVNHTIQTTSSGLVTTPLNYFGHAKVGTISMVYDNVVNAMRQVIDIDPAFALHYLTLNTKLSYTVVQPDCYNELIKVLTSESFLVFDRFPVVENLSISIIDTSNTLTALTFDENINTYVVELQDKGYDELGYGELYDLPGPVYKYDAKGNAIKQPWDENFFTSTQEILLDVGTASSGYDHLFDAAPGAMPDADPGTYDTDYYDQDAAQTSNTVDTSVYDGLSIVVIEDGSLSPAGWDEPSWDEQPWDADQITGTVYGYVTLHVGVKYTTPAPVTSLYVVLPRANASLKITDLNGNIIDPSHYSLIYQNLSNGLPLYLILLAASIQISVLSQ